MVEELIYQGNLVELKNLLAKNGAEYLKCNSDKNELAAIHWAANAGNIEIVKFYLEPPIEESPNLLRMNNFSPLHSAAMRGHTEIVKLLIDKGADVNIQTDPQKYAPIHSACFGGHLDTIKLLVKKGSDLTLQNYREEYPIDTANRQNQNKVVEYFESLKK